jgi:hypothetical protein
MRRVAWIAPLVAVGAAAGGCGTSDADRFSLRTPGSDDVVVREIDAGVPKVRHGKPTRSEVRVIRGWADALRAGHVKEASRFFAVPVKVLDGTNPLRTLDDHAAVVDFNRRLPCGAKVVGTKRGQNSLVLTTFELTERPGPGTCNGDVGALAAVGFLIEKRHIVQWLRGPDPPQPESKKS